MPLRETVVEREEKILAFWRTHRIFEKSEEGISGSFWSTVCRFFKKKHFIFYDGPPFATGLPHYGHILASAVKDAIPRYKTMRGYIVRRRWGWDCHGLPLEVEMEKEIGSKSKSDIEKYGIEKFNTGICRFVLQYADAWKKIIPRIGRWVDMENDYRTLSASYMESVWSIFHRLHKNGFVSRGFKSLHLCPRCSTTVSNTEVADSYEMLTDTAVYTLFPMKAYANTFFVAWTTTPWTLFGNVALGIGRDIEYAVVEENGKRYIVHSNAAHLFKNGHITATKKGSDFIGEEYLPPFDFLYADEKDDRVSEKIWRVYDVPYIDTEVGTGIVHLAPAYGSDDMETAEKHGLPIRHHVSKDGVFISKLGPFAGLRPKEQGNPKETDDKILDALRKKGVLLHSEDIEHSYPVCWRCSTPLLNYAADSWFVHADRYRDKMVAENRKVRWVPEHVRDGRFGNWLKDAQPWAVSRSRFWGAPLPIWQVEKTGQYLVIGSLSEMFARMRPRNTYTFVRHGHSVSNERKVFNCKPGSGWGLTESGKAQARKVAEELKDVKPTVIFSSPLERTRETADYIAKATGAKVIEDPLIIEMQLPDMHGRSYADVRDTAVASGAYRDMRKKIGSGESYNDVYVRMLKFLDAVDKQYSGAHIIVVTHKAVLVSARRVESLGVFRYSYLKEHFSPLNSNTGTFRLRYKPVKRTEDGDVDLHRPYIDDVVLYDDDGNPARHVREVFDCWFESGAMPYASQYYPFVDTPLFNPARNKGFPADFICEGLDQTRGWFYSLLAIGVGAFGRAPYRQVVATGIIRAADGKKMSKRLKNYSDPMDVVNRYGADALRHYLLGSPVMRGETLDFNDEQVDEIYKKVYMRLHNCFNFYAAYAHLPHVAGSRHPLDIYLLSRFAETHAAITKGFESYRLDVAVAPISAFVEDLSVWYLRRSRDRIRYDTKDGAHARETLRFVLTEFAKCIAPVAPFYAEHLFLSMQKFQMFSVLVPESVHLCRWPRGMSVNTRSIMTMNTARRIVSLAHEQRSEAGIKVRQPLMRVTIQQNIPVAVRTIIADELNVKEVLVNSGAKDEVVLDTILTPELRSEGFSREYVRNIQSIRKEMNLSLTETVHEMHICIPVEQQKHIQEYEETIKKETRVSTIIYSAKPIPDGRTIIIDGMDISVLLVERPGKIFR